MAGRSRSRKYARQLGGPVTSWYCGSAVDHVSGMDIRAGYLRRSRCTLAVWIPQHAAASTKSGPSLVRRARLNGPHQSAPVHRAVPYISKPTTDIADRDIKCPFRITFCRDSLVTGRPGASYGPTKKNAIRKKLEAVPVVAEEVPADSLCIGARVTATKLFSIRCLVRQWAL